MKHTSADTPVVSTCKSPTDGIVFAPATGGAGGGTPAVWSVYSTSGHYTLSNGDTTLTAINANGANTGAMADKQITAPAYLELSVDVLPLNNNVYFGVDDSSKFSWTVEAKYSEAVYGGRYGYIYSNGVSKVASLPKVLQAGDVIMMAFDPATAGIWFGLNGVWFSNTPPQTPSQSSTFAISGAAFYPVAGLQNGTSSGPNGVATLKTVTADLSYPAPAGFKPLGEI